jgi:hypothetical protein
VEFHEEGYLICFLNTSMHNDAELEFDGLDAIFERLFTRSLMSGVLLHVFVFVGSRYMME